MPDMVLMAPRDEAELNRSLRLALSLESPSAVRYPREKTGIRVGERFPDFTLLDSDGRVFDSRSVLGTSSALFVFFRGHF